MKRDQISVRAAPFVFESDLPESVKDLVGLLGWDRARQLIHEWGGIPFPVPRGPNNNAAGARRYAQLVEAIGEEGANLVISTYADETLVIPNCKQALSRARNRAMVAFYDRGATLEECARAFGCTTRWVTIVLKNVQPMPRDRALMLKTSDAAP